MLGGQGLDEVLAAPDHRPHDRIAGLAEILDGEVGVDGAVFQKQRMARLDVGIRLGGGGHGVQELRLPGGGSLSTAQKMPRSWIASKNALNSTGFTTKALTPSW